MGHLFGNNPNTIFKDGFIDGCTHSCLILKNFVLYAKSEISGSAENLKSAYVWLAG